VFNLRRLFDGLLLVIVGAVLLMNSLGILPWSIWYGAWRFWPVLLIIAGISLLLNRAIPFTALLCLTLIAVLVASWLWPAAVRLPWEPRGVRPFAGRELVNPTRRHDEVSRPLDAALATKPLKASLSLRAGRLVVQGATDQAFAAKFDYYGDRPTVTMNANDNGTALAIKSTGGGVDLPGLFRRDQSPWESWEVSFNRDAPLELSADLSAFDADLDLSEYNLTALTIDAAAGDLEVTLGGRSAGQKVDINANAGSVKLRVGSAARVAISVSASAGSVEIYVPNGAALRIRERAAVTSSNVKDLGLVKDGDYWVSRDYDAAAQKIDIDCSGAASSLRIVR